MSIIVALLLAAAQPGSVPATPSPDWRRLGMSGEHYVLSWDAASIVRGPETVIVRFKTEVAAAPADSPHTVSRLELRCAAGSARVIESITYQPNGLVSRRDMAPAPWQAIPPGTHIATIHAAVC